MPRPCLVQLLLLHRGCSHLFAFWFDSYASKPLAWNHFKRCQTLSPKASSCRNDLKKKYTQLELELNYVLDATGDGLGPMSAASLLERQPCFYQPSLLSTTVSWSISSCNNFGQWQALFRIQRAYCAIGQGEPFRTRPKHVLSGVVGLPCLLLSATQERQYIWDNKHRFPRKDVQLRLSGISFSLYAYELRPCISIHFLQTLPFSGLDAYTWIWGHDPAIAWCVWEAFAGLKTRVQGRM